MRSAATKPELATIKVADEVFIAAALLHQEHPDRPDFTISEIVDRASQENLAGELRPGVRVYTSLHAVANLEPNPGRDRVLYATAKVMRRLLLSKDDIHPARTGKIWPDPHEIPSQYVPLIDWAKERFGTDTPPNMWLNGITQMRGMGRSLWQNQDADDYVRGLRENWE